MNCDWTWTQNVFQLRSTFRISIYEITQKYSILVGGATLNSVCSQLSRCLTFHITYIVFCLVLFKFQQIFQFSDCSAPVFANCRTLAVSFFPFVTSLSNMECYFKALINSVFYLVILCVVPILNVSCVVIVSFLHWSNATAK